MHLEQHASHKFGRAIALTWRKGTTTTPPTLSHSAYHPHYVGYLSDVLYVAYLYKEQSQILQNLCELVIWPYHPIFHYSYFT